MKEISPSELSFVASQAILSAGDLLRKGFGTNYRISSKAGKQNLVTEYDTASQELIISIISNYFPDHEFLAEEGKETAPVNDKILWIIDPLDGTVNFAHNIPHFSISIAAWQKAEILIGLVYHPLSSELFLAEKCKGAFLNGKKIMVSTAKDLNQAIFATGFPYNAHQNPLHCIDRFSAMIQRGLPIRRLGSAALDLAYVAAGRFDAYWEVGLHPWDMAAGKLIVEEAGGMVSHYDGTKHPIFGYLPLLASNRHLHTQMVELLKEDLA